MSAVESIVVDSCASIREMLIYSRHPSAKQLGREGGKRQFSDGVTRLDVAEGVDLSQFDDDTFDEIHAYHVLNKIGAPGDVGFFFAMFSELWRILKPSGVLCLTLPPSTAAWADPGVVRVIDAKTITYLQQPYYDKNIGITWMGDYREIYKADFESLLMNDDGRELRVILSAVKPSRCTVG